MEFVNFNLAKKLREKGYPFNTTHHYDKNRHIIVALCDYDERCEYPMPTISQVLKWLREEKEVDLVIEPIFIYDENKRREYGVRVFALQLNKPVNCGYFNIWDDASIAGIEYVLDNLI